VEEEQIQILTEKEAEFAGFDRSLKSLTQQANSDITKLNEDLSRMNFAAEENGKIIEFLSCEKNKYENAFLKKSELTEIWKMSYLNHQISLIIF